jgi:transmembrane sensor
MTKENFLKLIERVGDGSASDQDIRLYHIWFNKFKSPNEWNDAKFGNDEEIKRLIENRINAQINPKFPYSIVKPLWARYAAAASILLCILFGGYFLHKQQSGQIAHYKNDITPGHNQATLTLANGQKFY